MTQNLIYLGDGERLDTYLSRVVPDYTRSYIKTLIDDKKILLEGQSVKAGKMLKPGQEISIENIVKVMPSAKPENLDIEIVYEDKDLVVVNKPYGMVVHPCTTTPEHTLVNALLFKISDLSGINGVLRPGIVHRLDKDTSGLMCVAKNDMAHKCLAAQLKDKSMHREYYAILTGGIKENEFVVNGALDRSRKDRKMMEVVKVGGREATSIFTVLRRYSGYTLVRVLLQTGRTHQIRAHARSINHPVVGDPIYGPKSDKTGHLMLVSKILAFIHPTTCAKMAFEIELPKYFVEFEKKLKN